MTDSPNKRRGSVPAEALIPLVRAMARDAARRDHEIEQLMTQGVPAIRKYREAFAYGRLSNRIAYVLDPSHLPEPKKGAAWKEDSSFNVKAALADDAGLLRVIKSVQKSGVEIVTRRG
jgi:hypothetical protein